MRASRSQTSPATPSGDTERAVGLAHYGPPQSAGMLGWEADLAVSTRCSARSSAFWAVVAYRSVNQRVRRAPACAHGSGGGPRPPPDEDTVALGGVISSRALERSGSAASAGGSASATGSVRSKSSQSTALLGLLAAAQELSWVRQRPPRLRGQTVQAAPATLGLQPSSVEHAGACDGCLPCHCRPAE